jgi:hypothetical protein
MSKWGKISYLICGLSIIVLFTARLIIQGWVDYMYVPLILALVAFVAAFAVDFKFYLEFLTMRTTKHGMNMGVLILLALVLVVAVNFLGNRFDKTFDLTKEKLNTLSDQSLEIVKNLKDDLNVYIFYKTKDLKDPAMEIKNDFRLFTAANPRVKVSVFNANLDVEKAKKYLQNNEAFATVIEYKGKTALITPGTGTQVRPVYQEKEITSALLKVVREKALTIHFLTGHGEKDIEQASMDGLKLFADELRRDGYGVEKLNLLTGDKMPEPPAVLAIVGPKMAYTDAELKQIREFADKGGRLLIAIDPGESHQLANLTKTFGVEFRNNFLANDVSGMDLGRFDVLGVQFDSASSITAKVAQLKSLAIFPQASELVKAPDAPADYTYKEIVKTSPYAYRLNSMMEKKASDERATYTVAFEVKSEKTSVVIYGDSDFLSDAIINRWVHLDLAMNTMAYLFDDTTNITIRPKSLESTKLEITPNKGLAIAIAGVSLPLCLIILSGVLWYRRRSL